MTPIHRMPEPGALLRQALVSDINDALSAARCAVELAGAQTDDFLVRELLLRVIQEIDRASAAMRGLM